MKATSPLSAFFPEHTAFLETNIDNVLSHETLHIIVYELTKDMKACIGIRREDKSRWERRVPVTPEDARKLKEEHGIKVRVQPSPIRVFSEKEFTQAGATVQGDLFPCPVIFAVKAQRITILLMGHY